MSIKILFIAYYYPPLAGSGVFRPMKMIRYMREEGYDVDVLTVDSISYHTKEETLLRESKANHIFRARSYDPLALINRFRKKKNTEKKPLIINEKKKKLINSFFPIDNKIGWYLPAVCKADELFKSAKYDLVFATIGPYTSALIALKISKKYHIPLIIDYRDHWSLNTYQFDYNPFNKLLAKHYEKAVLKQASLVSTIGIVMKDELTQHFMKNSKDKCIVAYNGFEESDFTYTEPVKSKEVKYVRYLGTFNANRTVKYFCQVLSELKEENYLFQNIIFEFYGTFDQETFSYLSQSIFQNIVRIKPQISHQKSIEMICSADVLLLFISSDDGPGVLTGKIFEYIRSGNMIFPMIRQDGEARALLEELGIDKSCAMEDITMIKNYLKEINENRFDNKVTQREKITAYSREKQCKKVIEMIPATLKNYHANK